MDKKEIRVVDLFAGIGGMRKGLDISLGKMGLSSRCVFSSEIDRHASETYFNNFGEIPEGDIRRVEELPPHEILLAGFPCQSFSYAGKGEGFNDTRGTLFFEIERLICRMGKSKPEVLLLENVPGLVKHDKGRTYGVIISRLTELGYSVHPFLLNSYNFGVPQNRCRIYLICTLDSSKVINIIEDKGVSDSHKFKKLKEEGKLPIPYRPFKLVKDILEDKVDSSYFCSAEFSNRISEALKSKGFTSVDGIRMTDTRGGNSLHSWDLSLRGHCSIEEISLLNDLLKYRRRIIGGSKKDGKKLTIDQISTFFNSSNLPRLLDSLESKKYLTKNDIGEYKTRCGNMSFEVHKFLDPNSVSVTLVSSDCHKLGVRSKEGFRRLTPLECSRIQGFPEDFILHEKDSHSYRQLGNSVSVPVISLIFDKIFEAYGII